MRKLIQKSLLLFLPVVVALTIYIAFFADGTSDPFYLRFTTSRFPSLVIGSSRAAQGIKPSVFNGSDLAFERNMYNFSFTVDHSPWGPLYLNAIKKKVDQNSKHGLFLLEVSPLSLFEKRGARGGVWPESELCVNTHFVNVNPNIEYMIRYYEKPFYKLSILEKLKDKKLLTNDGWVSVSISMDKVIVDKRKEEKSKEYQKRFQENTFSKIRLDYLKMTITYLKQHGKVALVRMPSSKELFILESHYMSNFDYTMQSLSNEDDIVYINLSENYSQYQTIDGSHLYKESSQKASEVILAGLLTDPRYGQTVDTKK